MHVAIRTLPRSPRALGGEDQIAFMLQEGFEALGHVVSVHFDRIRRDHDLAISMGIRDPAPSKRSMLWYFNESIQPYEAVRLGYGLVVTNSVDRDPCGPSCPKLPLAAHRSMLPRPGTEIAERGVGYVGNWSRYKDGAVRRYLEPLAAMIGDELSIYGGEGWRGHPVLSKHYRGMLHPDSWPHLRSMAATWVAFRSEAQGLMGMMPDRVYNMVAAGVRGVVTDGPVEPELLDMVSVHDDPKEWVEAAAAGPTTGSDTLGPALVSSSANYHRRAEEILKLCAGIL
jgi:hypothetical protein